MYMCGQTGAMAWHMDIRGKLAILSKTMWVLGMELKFSSLEARDFIH